MLIKSQNRGRTTIQHDIQTKFPYQVFYLFIWFIWFYLSLERGREGEREGEKHICVREILIGCLLHSPNQGPGPQPRHVPWPGIKLTFRCVGWCPTHWATPVRAALLLTTKGWEPYKYPWVEDWLNKYALSKEDLKQLVTQCNKLEYLHRAIFLDIRPLI